MNKQTFIEAIEAIQKQIKYDIEVSEKLGSIFKNAHSANLLPDNHYLGNILMKILQEEMNDTVLCSAGMSWIDWFCFETDFGNNSHFRAYDKDDKVIPLSNASELYDFLKSKGE